MNERGIFGSGPPARESERAGTVEFDAVHVELGGRDVLRDLTLRVAPSETLVLLGRSGSGKSTALRLVNRLLAPRRGEVRVDGRPTTTWDPILLRRRIGYVIQEIGLFPHFTVRRNVGLVPRLLGWESSTVEARVDELLTRIGLPPDRFAERHPVELSGGQRQRVGVARALAADPPILLCDEPFGALDPITRHGLQREFRELSRGLAKTILFVTHDLREALFLADRIAFLEAGELGFLGTPDAFLAADHPGGRAFVEAAGLGRDEPDGLGRDGPAGDAAWEGRDAGEPGGGD